jgi:hypothetical protein
MQELFPAISARIEGERVYFQQIAREIHDPREGARLIKDSFEFGSSGLSALEERMLGLPGLLDTF